MDRISQLPDELLGKVLLFLPTKVAVSTSILSKRWKFLWMWLPNLEYDDSDYSLSQRQSLRRFLNLNLRLHRARVIERLHLKFRTGPIGSPIKPKDIKLWVAVAVSRRIHELSLYLFDTISKHQTRLPSRLYMCKSIVILKLEGDILLDVPPTVCTLPCLKTLSLQRVSYLDEESLHQLLSNCPVLEDLDVKPVKNEYGFGIFRVIVPSLQTLTLDMFYSEDYEHMINTPSLKKLKVKDRSGRDVYDYDYYFEDMPKLEEADIDITYSSIDSFVKSITSVRRLSLCLEVYHSLFAPRYPEQNYYREGIVFNQLEHLQLCSCNEGWSDLLARLLKDSPNLRELEIYMNHEHDDMHYTICRQLINYSPEYVFWSLETFKWTQMYGSQEEVDLAKYILRNARNLQTATISFQRPSRMEEDRSVMMFEELFNCSRGSTCKLVLIQDLYPKLF